MSTTSRSGPTHRPVFFDPTRHRWIAVKFVSTLAIATVVGLFSLLAVRVGTMPAVSSVALGNPGQRTIIRQPLVLPQIADTLTAAGDGSDVIEASGFFPQPIPPLEEEAFPG